jgi:broad specificity phosphatase PhoE
MLVRHGEPALSRKVLLSSDQYRDWWGRYELGGLLPGQIPPSSLLTRGETADIVLTSGRRRAVETTQALLGNRNFEVDALFIEAPLPPPRLPGFLKLSPRIWGFVARFCWWFFNQHQGEESRAQAEIRAGLAADRVMELSAGGKPVMVVAHGFFNTMVGRELQARGWKCSLDQGYQYWCVRQFEPR